MAKVKLLILLLGSEQVNQRDKAGTVFPCFKTGIKHARRTNDQNNNGEFTTKKRTTSKISTANLNEINLFRKNSTCIGTVIEYNLLIICVGTYTLSLITESNECKWNLPRHEKK